MGAEILSVGASVSCLHGGAAVPTAASQRVRVRGSGVVTVIATYAISGCPPGPDHAPCVLGKFLTGASRVLAEGVPVVLQTSASICEPTGASLIIATVQARVTGN
jgi:hypothetical protein